MPPASAHYPSDLTDRQWIHIRRLIPSSKPIGAERVIPMRAVINAILYRQRSGCSWRMLPHDFPHWRTVYGYYRDWQTGGTWERIQAAIRSGTAASLPRIPVGATPVQTWTKSAC